MNRAMLGWVRLPARRRTVTPVKHPVKQPVKHPGDAP